MTTNEELFERCYSATDDAAARLRALHEQIGTGGVVLSGEFLPDIRKVRNNLRAALSAAQELKTRAKKSLKSKC